MISESMKVEDLEEFQPGDRVQHICGGEVFIVTANYGKRVTAVASADLTNSREWKLVRKAGQLKLRGPFNAEHDLSNYENSNVRDGVGDLLAGRMRREDADRLVELLNE